MIKLNSDIFPQKKDAYIVGGSVRDMLLNRLPKDFDIVVKENPEKFARQVALKNHGHFVKIGKAGKAIIRVILKNCPLDISTIKGCSIEDDLKERDFTINAIAYSLDTENFIDITQGLRDLENRIIRTVSKDVFQKDPIRLLRAYRISSEIGFKFEENTLSLIKNGSVLIQNSAGERIKDELFKILSAKNSYKYICQMAESGLLNAILPELTRLKGCNQNIFHSYDAYDHTLEAYRHLEKLINFELDSTTYIFKNYLDKKTKQLLKYSILLHDIGKPDSKTIDADGKIHFFNHDNKSAEMAKKICDRMKLSNLEKKTVNLIISNHLKPLHLFNLQFKNNLKTKTIIRFFKKCGELTPIILLHFIADSYGKKEIISDNIISFAIRLMKDFTSHFSIKLTEPPLLNGNDLIKDLGLNPSPLFSTVLNSVEDARLSGSIKNKKEALELAKKIILTG